MNMDTLPDKLDFVLFVEALPDDGLHRVAIAVEGMDAPIPTIMVAVDVDSALRIADRLNRRLRHDRGSLSMTVRKCSYSMKSGFEVFSPMHVLVGDARSSCG